MSRKFIIGLLLTLAMLAMLPFALVARVRASRSEKLPVHLVLDMDKQPKFKAQRLTPMFADERAMRPHIDGTLAQEDLILPTEILDDPLGPHLIDGAAHPVVLDDATAYAAVMLGRIRPPGMTDRQFDALRPPSKDDADINGDSTFYVRTVPVQFKVTADFIHRGEERFNIYCFPCHGLSGYGDGPVAQRAAALQAAGTDPNAASGWVQPQDLQQAKILGRPDGHIFNTITNGIRTMPRYDKQITVPDRWAIVAYLRALQRSQNASFDDLTREEQGVYPK